MEPKKVIQALDDESWVEAMQEELLQFKLLNYLTLVDLPHGKKVIGTKWVFRNKRDQRCIVVRNKASLVAQGYSQEEGVDYDEVFALVARIKAIRLFLAFTSFMGFTMYQMDVKSAFLYGTIEEEVYVSQPPGFVDPEFPNRVYKVEKALYGLHQAPRAWYETLSTYLLENRFRRGTIDKTLFIKKIKNDILLVQVYVDDIIFGSTKESLSTEFEQLMHKRFQMSSMGELTFFLGLQVEQRKDGIFLSQDKYVYDILKKFGFSSVKTASTPMETHKPLLQDTAGTDVDVHLYRSMIGSLMYLTSSRPDIMFAVCACSRFQVQPKASHMHAVKRIFRYLKGQPTLGLWYPKDSPMDLIAYSDSDYAGASIDRKSTTRGCQFLGCRLISWQCKKQIIVANSTTEAEYIAASNCCGQVLWLQNQLLDYGYNFMKTKIHVDNESAICVVKNPVYHSKTKHIEIRHHFIRDSYEKKLIEMVKIHTDYNVADLLTKAFDVTRFQFLIASIGKSKEVGTLRYLSLVVPLTKVGDKAVHKELGDTMEKAATTTSSLEAEQDSATASTNVNREVELTANIDGQAKTITKASLRRHLKLEDNGGITSLPNTEIFEPLALIGYATNSDKLTFQNGDFSPQLRFFIYTILHGLSPKKTSWEQFSSNIATAIICLATNRTFNFSKFIFDAMVKNLDNPHKFLIAPSTSPPPITETTPTKEEPALMPYESPLQSVQSLGRDEGSVSLNELMDLGRSLIEELDMDADISLVPPHAEIQEKASDETEVLLEEEESTEIVQDQGSFEKGEQEVSTADTAT
ncbi:putative ribonuclease H-like domain-containing protein [Tanacetum coccineum]